MPYSVKKEVTCSVRKDMQNIEKARVACLMYTFIERSKDGDDLSDGSHPNKTLCEEELTNCKRTRGNNQVTTSLKGALNFLNIMRTQHMV